MLRWIAPLVIFLFSPLSWSQKVSGTLSQLQNQLMQNNSELNSSRAKIEAQKSLESSRLGPFLPEVVFHAGYGKENTLADEHEGSIGYLSGNWNLFQGGRDWLSRDIATNETKISHLDFELRRRKLQRELGEAYYEALLNSHFISLDKEKIQFLRSQRAMVQKKINAGLTSQIDDLELDLEESTLNAEIDTHRTQLRNAISEIAVLVNSSSLMEIKNEPFPPLTTSDFEVQDLLLSPLLQRQILEEEISRLQLKQERGSYLPRVDMRAEHGQIIPQFEEPNKKPETRIFFSLSWTLFSGFETVQRVGAAEKATESQAWKKATTQTQLKSQLETLINKATELVRLQSLLEKRQALTLKYYELTLAEYRRGVKNSPDLANATNTYFENRTRLMQVQKDLAVLKLKYNELIP